MKRLLAVSLLLTLWLIPSAAQTAGEADEQTLKTAGVSTDGPALLDYLRRLIATTANRDKIKELIRKLGDDSFDVREKASHDLIALGRPAIPFLRQAMTDTDLEVVRRAENCIRLIDQGGVASYPAATIRLIALKKPAGAAEVLLNYLPVAEDESIADEVRTALATVALRDGKPDALLVGALSDKTPLRRAAAAEALCRAGAVDQKPAVVALLKDAEPTVRLRVGLALANLKERAALPVLIELLDQLPAAQLWAVEEVLLKLAGDQAPSVSLNDTEAARKKCREAWTAWWKEHGEKVDLARITNPPQLLGYTLVVLLDRGVVVELDKENKTRIQFEGVQFPLDVQILPGDRILVAEQQGDRVCERNAKGEVLWEKKVEAPLVAQRLPNGNTFIANRTQLLEVDRTGKEVFSHVPPDGDGIMRAVKLRNGDIGIVTLGQNFTRLDSTGAKLRSFPVAVNTSGGRIEVLPNGHVLIPQMRDNKVVEYDADGKVVWSVTVEQPIAAVRLPNGNTLATSMTQKRAVEFDKSGKEVWEYRSDTRVTRALRR